jgi:hypothetical protein
LGSELKTVIEKKRKKGIPSKSGGVIIVEIQGDLPIG